MKTQWLILALGLAAASLGTACGGTDEGMTWIDSGDESEDPYATGRDTTKKEATTDGTTKPGLEEQGGFWGDGYHEEDVDLDKP